MATGDNAKAWSPYTRKRSLWPYLPVLVASMYSITAWSSYDDDTPRIGQVILGMPSLVSLIAVVLYLTHWMGNPTNQSIARSLKLTPTGNLAFLKGELFTFTVTMMLAAAPGLMLVLWQWVGSVIPFVTARTPEDWVLFTLLSVVLSVPIDVLLVLGAYTWLRNRTAVIIVAMVLLPLRILVVPLFLENYLGGMHRLGMTVIFIVVQFSNALVLLLTGMPVLRACARVLGDEDTE